MKRWTIEFTLGGLAALGEWMPIKLSATITYEEELPRGLKSPKQPKGKVIERSTFMSGSAIIHYAVVEHEDGEGGMLLVDGDEERYRKDAAFRVGVDHLRRRLTETR